jgi:hypothetical protein
VSEGVGVPEGVLRLCQGRAGGLLVCVCQLRAASFSSCTYTLGLTWPMGTTGVSRTSGLALMIED